MPWRTETPMTQKMKFLTAYLEQREPSFAALCRRFGISRKTGYALVKRFTEEGLEGLKERSRAPKRHPNQTPDVIEQRILAFRREHPTWGPRKIVAYLTRHEPDLAIPAASTVGAILQRNGMVAPRRRRRRVARPETPLSGSQQPNDVWCVDYKGQFQLRGKGPYCHPLTISDLHSRYVLRCQALSSTRHAYAYPIFLSAFREYGLPLVIRSDNGPPFASRAPGGLSRLAVWWIRLGVRPERIEPAQPQQNGVHERMHKTLKAEATRPPERTLGAQQRRFSRWMGEFNELRPHDSLDMLTPSDCYASSPRPYPRRLALPEYDTDFGVARFREQGAACFKGRTIYAGRNLAGLHIGLRAIDDGLYEVCFFDYSLGVVDMRDEGSLRPANRMRR